MRIHSILLKGDNNSMEFESCIILKPFEDAKEINDNFIAHGEDVPFDALYTILNEKRLKNGINSYIKNGNKLNIDIDIIDGIGQKVQLEQYVFTGFLHIPNTDNRIIVEKICGITKENTKMVLKTAKILRKAIKFQEKNS